MQGGLLPCALELWRRSGSSAVAAVSLLCPPPASFFTGDADDRGALDARPDPAALPPEERAADAEHVLDKLSQSGLEVPDLRTTELAKALHTQEGGSLPPADVARVLHAPRGSNQPPRSLARVALARVCLPLPMPAPLQRTTHYHARRVSAYHCPRPLPCPFPPPPCCPTPRPRPAAA